MNPFILSVLADESPNATDLDSAVEMSINAWQRATGSSHCDYTVSRNSRNGRKQVTLDAPIDESRDLPRGKGADLVDAFRDFIRALWTQVDEINAQKSSAAE